MQIEVLQPRAVLLGDHVFFPGVNECTPEFLEALQKNRGWQKTLEQLARPGHIRTVNGAGSKNDEGKVVRVAYSERDTAPVIRVLEDGDTGAKYARGDSLVGLSDDVAMKLIDGTDDPVQLKRWLKGAKKQVAETIKIKLELLKEGA